MTTIRVKRVYGPPSPDDGWRVLVDRLWPRGLSKERAALDYWAKDSAPSAALREWFANDAAKWADFKARYQEELAHSGALDTLRCQLAEHEVATLLFAASDIAHNNAVALQEFLHTEE